MKDTTQQPVAAMRRQLQQQLQYEALCGELRCLSEALISDAPPPCEPYKPGPLMPLGRGLSSDGSGTWPRIEGAVPQSTGAGLSNESLAASDERALQLLHAFNSGLGGAAVLSAAAPPPHEGADVPAAAFGAPFGRMAAPSARTLTQADLATLDDEELRPER